METSTKSARKSIVRSSIVQIHNVWSQPHIGISVLSVILIILFLSLYNRREYKSIQSLTNNNFDNNNIRISCLLLGDPNKDHTFQMLSIYDKYLHPYCDIKVFLIKTTSDSYNITQYAAQLSHCDINFVASTQYAHWKQRRFYNYHIVSYTFKHYVDKYERYLKFPELTHLIFVDNFKRLINNIDLDMNKPQILGHYIQYKQCMDFIYALSVYAMNSEFIKTIGKKAYHRISDGIVNVDDTTHCSASHCTHHTENDFGSFCLDDMDIEIKPIRDIMDREYFLIFQAKDHYVAMNEWKENDWYWIGKNKQSVADNCCAQYPIVFSNYRKPSVVEKYYEQMYNQKPEERNIAFIGTNFT